MSGFLKKIYSISFLYLFFTSGLFGQVDLSYYLPGEITYNENIGTPASIIGHEIGEWHITHDKLVYYFYHLADVSPRVKVEKIGQTYEYRPLLNVIITSEENHKKLEQLRLDHLNLSDPEHSKDINMEDMPVVIRLGYSVHGNEQSGANSSLLVAYHLAAAQGKEIDEILKYSIILIDPSLNPDGMQRFSTWVNEHKSKNLNDDPNGREFGEAWPGGRTNHYWFDLNRDWLLAQHPESKARIKIYHAWRPNVQTDHHEMGSDATFFFQPGILSRYHPLIPETNIDLTTKIGNFHARALDHHKRLYYSKESFDDFYFGKGSTYPDIHGSIGILFEQASSRGHLRETQHGELSFPFTIKNQFITSLSTIEASLQLRIELLNFQKTYYRDAVAKNNPDANRGLILGSKGDVARLIELGEVLLQHQIRIYKPTKNIVYAGDQYDAESSFVIPLNQPQKNLVKVIFERRTSFKDSLFYDVSAWNFDLSYNINLSWIDNMASAKLIGAEITQLEMPAGEILGNGDFAYAIPWDQYYAPGMLNALLEKEFIIKISTASFTTETGDKFERGTIMIPVGIQAKSNEEIRSAVEKYASKYHVKVKSIESGLSVKGADLGSNSFRNIRQPKVAMIVGRGASAYEAGEVWHLLDQRYDMHVTMISSEMVDRIKLGKYNTLILSGGHYSSLSASSQGKIKNWVKEGGTLVAWKDALRFVAKLQIAEIKFKKASQDTTSEIAYADRTKTRGAQVIGGAIFNMNIDKTHPLAYGYDQETLAVFKRGNLTLEPSKRTVSNPFKYAENPLLSGYASDENITLLKGTPAVNISSYGEGKVIAFTDNHNFRAFWYGTNRLFINAIFFGDQISTR